MKKEKRSNAVFYGLMGIMLGLFCDFLNSNRWKKYLSISVL